MGNKRYRVQIEEDGSITRINVEDMKPFSESRGHKQHKSGAGPHADKREKRNRTRQNQLRQALEPDE